MVSGPVTQGTFLMNFLTNKHFGGTSTRTTEYRPFFLFFSYIVFGVTFYAKDEYTVENGDAQV